MKNDTHTYKILVLSGLNNSTVPTVRAAVGLANMVDGEIDFFHVKPPTDIVGTYNQLSANKVINEEQLAITKKIQKILNPINKEYNINIKPSFSFGNIKREIGKHIKEQQPDIIVLGKRKSKLFSFIGDGITNYVLKKFNGIVMISANSNAMQPDTHISIAAINGLENELHKDFSDNLLSHAHEPIKVFKIIKTSGKLSESPTDTVKKDYEYVFEHGDNTIKNLSKYISKNNINLLLVDRVKKESKSSKNLSETDINAVINNLNVSLLIFGTQKTPIKNVNTSKKEPITN